jgi:diguanylate cyclase (GGDEF)-like protein
MAVPMTTILNRELERILKASVPSPNDENVAARDEEVAAIFRTYAAMRLAAADVLRRYADRMSNEELIESQLALSARLDEWLAPKIGALIDQRERELAEKSERDPVTALPNRAAFDRKLQEEIERARRYRRDLSVVLFDVDQFKSINDRFGHPAGDHALAEVARVLKSSLRQSDAVFRYGGDEFAAICPETSGDAMTCALRRLESNIPIESRIREIGVEHLDISWGVAAFPSDAVEENALIRIADERLYACKRARGRVTNAVF